MSSHEFLVTVEVDDNGTDWTSDEYHRTAADYAHGALWAAGLRQAKVLDGFADLPAEASIESVEKL